MSAGWVSKLVARYRAEGEAALQPRSRRPKSSPTALPMATVELITALRQQLAAAGHDAGPHFNAWHLQHHHALTVCPATIWRHLKSAGLITAAPKKRPKAS